MKLLGIDYGDKKIGLAFGESLAGIAVPLEVIENTGLDNVLAFIEEQIKTEDIEKIIIGAPLSQGNHHTSKQLEKTRAFIKAVSDRVDVPVEEEDESYTTTESLRLQKEEGTDVPEDALAAMLIVQSYLDRTTFGA